MASTILVVEHEAQCPPARLGDWLRAAGAELEVCRPYASDDLPPVASYDGLLVLGGSMSANDDSVPWLAPLRAMVRDAAESGTPTWGVCLGHQVIARALGGTVGVNPRGQQVGVLATGWLSSADGDALFGQVRPSRTIQWNHDLVTALPDGAVALAETAGGELQVARFAPTVWGTQMHPEVTRTICAQWLEEDRDEHVARGIDPEGLLAEVTAAEDDLAEAWEPVAREFAALVGESA